MEIFEITPARFDVQIRRRQNGENLFRHPVSDFDSEVNEREYHNNNLRNLD